MAAMNPNPSRISGAIWWLWTDFDSVEPTVQLGGVYAAKPGYHNYRFALGTWDYSVGEVAADRNGPGDKAAAIDLTMSSSAMIKYTTRLRDAAKHRDERLWIGGVPILREFIGTDNGARVYCYVLTGGRARGLGADAADDWGRDNTHLWHLHLSFIRQFCADSGAMSRVASVLRGESLATWKARVNPAPATPAPVEEEEDEMSFLNVEVPQGFAYDENEQLLDRKLTRRSATPAAGFSGAHPAVKDKRLYLSLSSDHIPPGASVRVRVAIQNGGGYTIHKILTDGGEREPIQVPAAANAQAFGITVGRMRSGPDAAEGESDAPVVVLLEVA